MREKKDEGKKEREWKEEKEKREKTKREREKEKERKRQRDLCYTMGRNMSIIYLLWTSKLPINNK